MVPLKPSQIRLRTILIAAAILPPVVGAFAGVFGEFVQVWVLVLLFVPLIVLSMVGGAFVLGYVMQVVPLSLLGRAIDALQRCRTR